MIFCSIHINYLSQFKRCGRVGADQLIQNLHSIAKEFNGRSDSKDEPLRVNFELDSLFSGIQAAEAIHRLKVQLDNFAVELRGATILVYALESDELDATAFHLTKTAQSKNIGLYFSKEARKSLSAYFDFLQEDGSYLAAVYRYAAVLDSEGLSRLAFRPATAKAIANYLDSGKSDGSRVLHIKMENSNHSAKAMEAVFDSIRLTRQGSHQLIGTLHGRASSYRPLVPFSNCLDQTLLALARGGADKNTLELLDRLEPAFTYIQNTVESTSLPAALAAAGNSYINLLLDLLGDTGEGRCSWLICNRLEDFSKEAVELISRRLQESRGQERYLVISNQAPPAEWLNLDPKTVNVVGCPEENAALLLGQVLETATPLPSELLEARAADISGISGTSENSSLTSQALLEWLPPEAKDLLFALSLAENSLDEQVFKDFIRTAGLEAAGLDFLQGLLVRCGYLDPLVKMNFMPPRYNTRGSTPGNEKKLEKLYLSFLISQYRKGKIVPSVQLLRKTGESQSDERFVFDCIMNTALRPDNQSDIDTGFLSASARSLFNFYQAANEGSKKRQSTALLRASESLDTENKASILALLQAEFAYAEGSTDQLARKAREALLLITRSAPPKLSARIQRIMGLSALTLEKYTDAIDYLTNAAEIAETSNEHYELSQALYTRALAEFINGSIVKAAKSVEAAIQKTGMLCRPDMAVQQGMLSARIDMELGLYDEAVRRFSALAAIAEDNDLVSAGLRANIWQARCLGYAGNTAVARAQLEEYKADPEACVFLAELELMANRPEQALTLLRNRPEAQPRTFLPPDRFKASSLFQEIEGRCIAFDRDTAILDDMREALFLLSSGLVERNADRALDLANLTRSPRMAKNNPSLPVFCMYCYLLEEELNQEPVDKQTILSRAFNALQQRAGRIEDRANRALFMEKNIWNRKLLAAAREHKFL